MKNKLLPFLLLATVGCKFNKEPDRQPIVLQEIDYQLPYLFTSQIEHDLATETAEWKYQKAASEYAAKGDYKNAMLTWDLGMPGGEKTYSQEEIDSINQTYEIRNAKDYIIEVADDEQVIIINEAHHNSSHRFFTKSLLQGLYDKGYRYFGLEALSPGKWMDSTLNERKYPIQGSGYYIKDPQFGDLVRKAMEIGFEVFPYEDTTNASGKFREIGQAKQIADMIRKHPEGKFLIHCGFAHAYEGEYEAWEKTMAGRLKEFTQIDPYTITQTTYSERGDSTFNLPLLKALDPKESSVLINKESGKAFGYDWKTNYTDLAIIHPMSTYFDGRPNWLFSQGNTKAEIYVPEHKMSYPLMFLAFKAGEDVQRAVPMDIVEADSTDTEVLMALPAGNYSIILADSVDAMVFDWKVE